MVSESWTRRSRWCCSSGSRTAELHGDLVPGCLGRERDAAVVSWTPPHAGAVLGYTVSVHTDKGVTDIDVDGMTVRAEVLLPAGSWWTVTAHLSSWDLVTYPQSPDSSVNVRPERLTGIHMSRSGDRMHITWDVPMTRAGLTRSKPWSTTTMPAAVAGARSASIRTNPSRRG